MAKRKIPVVIDCDPGLDDAAALLMAFRCSHLDIRAITTVAGNVELEKTTANALKICSFIGADVPIASGAGKPLFRKLTTAAHVHGPDGLKGVVLPESHLSPSSEPAWDLIHRIAVECGGELELITLGPLTNIAIALAKYADLPRLIKRILMMGGSSSYGNTTPAAEFNVYVDPEAADKVLQCGIPVYMCGLNLTFQAYLTGEEIHRIGQIDNPYARFMENVTACDLERNMNNYGLNGVPMHDPCPVLLAEFPELFRWQKCWIRVETESDLTLGKTVTDYYSDAQREPNAYLVTEIDREGFVEKVLQLFAAYEK